MRDDEQKKPQSAPIDTDPRELQDLQPEREQWPNFQEALESPPWELPTLEELLSEQGYFDPDADDDSGEKS